jgi:serine protease Do
MQGEVSMMPRSRPFRWLALCGALCWSAAAAEEAPPPRAPTLADFDRAFVEIAEKVRPSVVAIVVTPGRRSDALLPGRKVSLSGVVWDGEGHIVSLGRDFEGAAEILVVPLTGDPFAARLVGVDPATEVALLEAAAATSLPALEHGSTDALRPGSLVVSVGNPFGLEHSVTLGNIAGLGRTVRRGGAVVREAIQVTTPVNPGDPGGLVADAHGRLVGLLASTLRWPGQAGGQDDFLEELLRRLERSYGEAGGESPRGRLESLPLFGHEARGINFALPVEAVAAAVVRVLRAAAEDAGWLGVEVAPLEAAARGTLGLQGEVGVIITAVLEGSPAAKATVAADDVVLEFGGAPVPDIFALRELVIGKRPGERVAIVVWREGRRLSLEVTIEPRR